MLIIENVESLQMYEKEEKKIPLVIKSPRGNHY